jgi:hypothetical protein
MCGSICCIIWICCIIADSDLPEIEPELPVACGVAGNTRRHQSSFPVVASRQWPLP